MLVKFVSSTDGALQMFADVAAPILQYLGKAPAAREAAEHEIPVSLRQRVTPLIDLLRHTAAHEGYLLWEAPQDFGGAAA